MAAIGCAMVTPATAVEITYDDMPYFQTNYGAFNTRLFSSASDVLSEDYFVLDPLGPDTISGTNDNIDWEETDGSDLASARAELGPTMFSPNRARAQTEFYRSRTFTDTLRTGEYVDTEGEYFASNRNSAKTESTWIDEWSFDVSGWVEVVVSFEADISLNAHVSGNHPGNPFAVNNGANDVGILGIDEATFDKWGFDFDARFGIFDRNTLVECEDCDDGDLVPLNVGSVSVVATTDFEILPGGGGVIISEDQLALEAGDDISIHLTETIRFYAIAGHTYHVINDIRNDSDDGVTVDAFNTVALQVVKTEPGMILLSRAVEDFGASLNVQVIPEVHPLWMISAAMATLILLRFRTQTPGARLRVRCDVRASYPAQAALKS